MRSNQPIEAFQLADDGFAELVQGNARIFPSLSGRDHLPEQHPRQIIPRRPTSGPGLIPYMLLADCLFCIALFLRFPAHCLSPCCGASASVPAMQGTSVAACVDISEGRFVSNRQPDCRLQTRFAGIADQEFGNDRIGTGIAEG